MLQDEHALFRENIPAYAISALDMQDVATFEAHLKTCITCQGELAEYRSVTSGLLQAIPPKAPSPELRRKLISHLPARQSPTRNLLMDFFSRFSLRQLATTALLVILVLSNLYSSLQLRALKQQQAILAEKLRSEQVVIAMLAHPGTQTLTVNADVQKLAGSMLVDKTQNTAVLFLWYLPVLEPSQTYQAWLIDANGKRISGGLFTAITNQEYTAITIQSPVPIENFVGVGVTIEPQGGSEKPTGPRVLIVNL
ncbi:MAG: anti-sigma factor [Chloroflexota bacterium]